MLTKHQIKLFKSLSNKKYRNFEKKIIIEGHRLIQEAILAKAKFDGIWYTEEYFQKNTQFITELKNSEIKCQKTSSKSLSQICDSQNNQGIIALHALPNRSEYKVSNSPALLLDNISDPGNMGSILRTVGWFGIKNVICSPKCVDPYNSKVVRSGMGAHFYLDQIIQTSLSQLIPQLKNEGFNIIGAEIDGTAINKFSLPPKWGLVLGNEAHGISSNLKSLLDKSVTIPKSGNIESLNVAVASGVILSSFV